MKEHAPFSPTPALFPVEHQPPVDLQQRTAVFRNMLHAEFLRVQGLEAPDEFTRLSWMGAAREQLIRLYGFAVVSNEAARQIAEIVRAAGHVGIDDLAAGTGFTAQVIGMRRKISVRAFDLGVDEFARPYGEVTRADAVQQAPITARENRAMFLSWPSLDGEWATEALRAYRHAGGRTFVHIHEGPNNCTGTRSLYDELEHHWTETGSVWIPSWPRIHDGVTIYTVT